jgi:long-subunit fatty acid transport protein
VGKKYLFVIALAVLQAVPLFAYLPGDLVFNPEVQAGFEIPTIRQNADYPVGKENGDYVSLGFCWGLRLSASYRLTKTFSAGLGLGLEGIHNQYNFTYYVQGNEGSSYIERSTYETYYFVIPAGFQAHIQALNLGGGLAAYIPLAAEFSGDIKQGDVYSTVTDAGFNVSPFLGGYFDIGYDWAEKDGNSRGFNVNLRVEASFSDKIADGIMDYKTFRHAAVSLSAGYSFRAMNFR